MILTKKLLTLCITFSILSSISVSNASDKLLATISSDIDDNVYQLTAISNNQDQTLESFIVSNISSKGLLTYKRIPLDNFLRNGMHLNQAGARVFSNIYSSNVDEQVGGIVVLESTVKSMSNQIKTCELELVKDQAEWKLYYEGKPITQIHSILGIVGILDLSLK
jgi:hypothetical protein